MVYDSMDALKVHLMECVDSWVRKSQPFKIVLHSGADERFLLFCADSSTIVSSKGKVIVKDVADWGFMKGNYAVFWYDNFITIDSGVALVLSLYDVEEIIVLDQKKA